MPDYKKKRVSRLPLAGKKPKRASPPSDDKIVMKPSVEKKSPVDGENLKVVKGRKLEQKRRFRIVSVCLAAAILVYAVLSLILPVGISENIGNAAAAFGSGSYPAQTDGSETENVISRGGYYYLLTDTHISARSDSGKKIYSHAHGFENPVLRTSATRALVFGQGSNSAAIYNLYKKVSTVKTEKPILNACISRSGTYAIVTESDSYASTVSVYDKKDKLLFEWNSSEDIVNNAVLSPNGKKLAVSTLKSSGGQYASKVYVLGYGSASPEYSEEYSGTAVLALDSSTNSGFSVLTSNRLSFVSWSKYTKTDYSNEYRLSMFRTGGGNLLAVYNRSSDRTDNRIAIFSSSGKLISEFEFNGAISDIETSGGHIYCISDTHIYLLDSAGKVLREAECGFGGVRLAVLSTYDVAVITDNAIEKIQLEQGEGA